MQDELVQAASDRPTTAVQVMCGIWTEFLTLRPNKTSLK